MSQKLLTGNVLVLFCCVGLAVVPEVKSLVCTDSDAYNHLHDFLNHDTCESVDLVFKYLHDMTEQKSNGECRRDIINKLANYFGKNAHTPEHCQCFGTFQLQHYSTSPTVGISEDLLRTCLHNQTGYREMYHQFFHGPHESHNQVCRTHHSLWTQLREIHDHMCQKDIVYHISYAFSQHDDPCRCTAISTTSKTTATTTSTTQKTTTPTTTTKHSDVSSQCADNNSYRYLNNFIQTDKCESVDLVFKYLHDMTEEKKGNGTCRRNIIDKLANHFGTQAHTPDHCLCTGTFTLQHYSTSNNDGIHGDFADTCMRNHNAYREVYQHFFPSDNQQHLVCRTHHSLWTQLRDIHDDHCEKDIVYHISYAFSQHGDPCSCSEKPVTTLSPDQHQGHHDHCYQYDSYRELASLVNHSKCLSANTVWHLLDNLQKHDSGCRTRIQNLLLHSYSKVLLNGNSECECFPKHEHALTNKQHLHYTNNDSGNHIYSGCRDRETGSTYKVIESDLFTQIADHGCKNHNYLWQTLAGVKNHTSSHGHGTYDCILDLITRAAMDYPSRDSDNCVCAHKTITSYTLATKTTTTSTAQQTSMPTTTTTTTTTTKTTTSTTQQPSTPTTSTTTTPATTTKSDVQTTPHGSIEVPQTTVSSHNENGWESWSPWTCKITKSDLFATCHSYRQRHCLSNMATDCEGSPFETMDCDHTQCIGADITNVHCGLYNQHSTCEDQKLCTNYSNTPWQICVDADYVAKCPRLCGCCPITTTTTTSTTTTAAPTTTATQTTSQETTTIKQPSTPVPLRQCNHTCTLDAVILSTAVKHSKADNCTSALNEALPQDCCTMGNQSSWNKGAQVQLNQVCNDGTPPPYTPIAAYNGTGLVPDSAGIFYGCNKDGQSGFMMVHQTCDQLPHLLHVDGTSGTPEKDPNKYFVIY